MNNSSKMGELMDRFKIERPSEATTLEDVKDAINKRMDLLEENMTLILGRILDEVTQLRSENATLKNQLQLEAQPTLTIAKVSSSKVDTSSMDPLEDHQHMDDGYIKYEVRESRGYGIKETILPPHPFQSIDDFLEFDNEMEVMEMHQRLVADLCEIRCNNSEKFIRTCWRKLITDQVAENFCWRGTSIKKSIRDMSVTVALRTAFTRKYAMTDDTYDKVCRKYFQYAHDRQIKLLKYRQNKG